MPFLSFKIVALTNFPSDTSISFPLPLHIACFVDASLLQLKSMGAYIHVFRTSLRPFQKLQSTLLCFCNHICMYLLCSSGFPPYTSFRTISLTFRNFLLCVLHPVRMYIVERLYSWSRSSSSHIMFLSSVHLPSCLLLRCVLLFRRHLTHRVLLYLAEVLHYIFFSPSLNFFRIDYHRVKGRTRSAMVAIFLCHHWYVAFQHFFLSHASGSILHYSLCINHCFVATSIVSNYIQAPRLQQPPLVSLLSGPTACVVALSFERITLYWNVLPFLPFPSNHPFFFLQNNPGKHSPISNAIKLVFVSCCEGGP